MKSIELSKERKEDVITNIRRFFWSERGEEVSDFQAAIFLEFVLKDVGPYIYNQAITDAYILMSQKIEDLYGLEKRSR